MFPRNPGYDVVVVGARCAGASTAMLLARQGARVLVVDHDQPGSDTMSTHALMRTGVFQLHKWGILDRIHAAGTPPVRRTTFLYGDEEIGIDIKPENGIEALYAPRRPVLDGALVEAASEAGVTFRFGTGCVGVVRDENGRVTGVRLQSGPIQTETVMADLVIGADGRRSAVARHVGAPVLRTARNSVACAYAYVEDHEADGFRWHHARGSAGGIIPTNEDRACVFIALPPDRLRDARKSGPLDTIVLAQTHLPRLAEELSRSRIVASPVVFSGQPGYFRRSAGDGWALVGDAGYFRDPITAHGISDALRDAELLSDAIVADRLADYPAQRDALSSRFFELTDRIAAFDWSLEELKPLHVELNKSMRDNLRQVAEGLDYYAQAA